MQDELQEIRALLESQGTTEAIVKKLQNTRARRVSSLLRVWSGVHYMGSCNVLGCGKIALLRV